MNSNSTHNTPRAAFTLPIEDDLNKLVTLQQLLVCGLSTDITVMKSEVETLTHALESKTQALHAHVKEIKEMIASPGADSDIITDETMKLKCEQKELEELTKETETKTQNLRDKTSLLMAEVDKLQKMVEKDE